MRSLAFLLTLMGLHTGCAVSAVPLAELESATFTITNLGLTTGHLAAELSAPVPCFEAPLELSAFAVGEAEANRLTGCDEERDEALARFSVRLGRGIVPSLADGRLPELSLSDDTGTVDLDIEPPFRPFASTFEDAIIGDGTEQSPAVVVQGNFFRLTELDITDADRAKEFEGLFYNASGAFYVHVSRDVLDLRARVSPDPFAFGPGIIVIYNLPPERTSDCAPGFSCEHWTQAVATVAHVDVRPE